MLREAIGGDFATWLAKGVMLSPIGGGRRLKDFFKGDEFLFSKGNAQIDDFSLIINCDHNILSHASSFGWWAAYVNPNPNKIVVAPEYYHPDEPNLKRDKFYPKEYILK